MNILFTRFPLESRFGGAEVQTLSLAEGLRSNGYDVAFLGSCPTLCEEFRNSQFPITQLNIGDPPVTKWGAVSFFWRRIGMKKNLIGAMEQSINGAIVMLSLSEKLLLTNWCVHQGMKVIWIEHDRVGRWLKKNPWLPKLRSLSRKVKTVTVSELSRQIYLDLGWRAEDVVAIPNGISVQDFPARNGAMEQWSNGAIFRIGCVSRLTHDKGIDVLIKAVAELQNVSLEIVGTGRDEEKIKALLQQSLPPTTYHLPPSVPNITDFYHRIDCLVLPSRENDPFGICVAEAMACGIPVIITDECGIAAHLDPDDAIVVPADNVEVLREALTEVQKPEIWEKLSEQGPKVVRDKFSVEQMIKRYEELLT